MTYVIQGDTIRLNGYFEEFDGTPKNPAATFLKVYDNMGVELVSASTVTGVTDSAIGTWYYDYTTVNIGAHFYEFHGKLSGYEIIDRGTFYVVWS